MEFTLGIISTLAFFQFIFFQYQFEKSKHIIMNLNYLIKKGKPINYESKLKLYLPNFWLGQSIYNEFIIIDKHLKIDEYKIEVDNYLKNKRLRRISIKVLIIVTVTNLLLSSIF
jgi:hypothetical protein